MMSGFCVPVNSFPCCDPVVAGNGVGAGVDFAVAFIIGGVVYTGSAGWVVVSIVCVGVTAGAIGDGGVVAGEVAGESLAGGAVVGSVLTGAMGAIGKEAATCSKQYCGVRAPVRSVR